MAVAVSYPGVYIEEIPSGVSTIVGVATSIGAFVDYFPQGPMNTPVQIFSFADFERQFGGLDTNSEASYAIQQFFLNGGTEAYVVRVTSATAANAAAAAAIGMASSAGANVTPVLLATAASPGQWGNNVLIEVDYGTTDPTTLFNLTITEVSVSNGVASIVATETFRNLLIDPTQSNDAVAVVNAGSQLITLKSNGGTGSMPAQNGTVSAPLTNYGSNGIASLKLALTDVMEVAVVVAGQNAPAAVASPALSTIWQSIPTSLPLASLASVIQRLLRNTVDGSQNPVCPNATVSVAGSSSGTAFLVAESGTSAATDILALTTGLAQKLGFDNAKTQNIQQYALGGAVAAGAQTLSPQQNPPAKAAPGGNGKWDPVGDAAGITR